MPLLWLYGVFVTSHNYTLCLGVTWHNVYYATAGDVTNCTEQKRRRRGPPLPGRNRHFLRSALVVSDIMPKILGLFVFLCVSVLPRTVAGAAVGDAIPLKSQRGPERFLLFFLGNCLCSMFFALLTLSKPEAKSRFEGARVN